VVVDGDLDLVVQPDGWKGTMHLADGVGATLAGGTGIFGVPGDDGSALALAFVPAVVGAGGPDDVQSVWIYRFLRLDGQPVTANVEPMSEGLRASVSGVYVDPSGQQYEATLNLELLLIGGSLSVDSVTLVVRDGQSAAGITAQPGSLFAPTRITVSGADVVGEELGTPIDPTSFEIGVEELAPGDRFYASIVAFLPDGSSAVRSAVATRP
jgi:hypothetical protein